MVLGFNLSFNDLNSLEGLKKLDRIFLDYCDQHCQTLLLFRTGPEAVSEPIYSSFLLDLAPLLDDFLAKLFNVEPEANRLKQQAQQFDRIYECQRKFVQRIAVKRYPYQQLATINFPDCARRLTELFNQPITEQIFAEKIRQWQLAEDQYLECLDVAAQYAAFMVHNHSSCPLFDLPNKIDHHQPVSPKKIKRCQQNTQAGFDYFAPAINSSSALNQANYCLYCHNQGKDSCSKGLNTVSPKQPSAAASKLGCPLKQKISEMNYLKARGFDLAALAVIIIDNPLVAATGHRICHDCLDACIFQKQDPVNIPVIESNILATILQLPYGAEIYLLLTRWNPLNIYSPLPKSLTGYNVLVVGLGPAGFSLAHYLLNDGHNVVAIDGLRISPLAMDKMQPIKCWQQYQQKLSQRQPQGFGGVAEYGITSRWDKNNLTLIRLILERRAHFKFYDNISLGNNLTAEQALSLGFDHLAICTGAGPPKILKALAYVKGVKIATDFLMTLQAGGAFLKASLTNLTIRMPVAVIGGGLTAVDAAVEALNYYPVQVEKFLQRYEILQQTMTNQQITAAWSPEDKLVAKEFIADAKLLRRQKTPAGVKKILAKLGGVTIYYRGKLQDSPAYQLSPDEIMYAAARGVNFAENMSPVKINTDKHGYAASIDFGSCVRRAKTGLIAIGTTHGCCVTLPVNNLAISYFGDCNPLFSGSVVKAIASSKNGYRLISQQLNAAWPAVTSHAAAWFKKLDDLLLSRISQVNILSSQITELVIHSPLAAKNFQPGQFFRLQNYSGQVEQLIEPLALTGASADPDRGLVQLVIINNGLSSQLLAALEPGQLVALMGPAGRPAVFPAPNSRVMLIGGGIGNVGLPLLAKALKNNGNNVSYFAGYKKASERFCQLEIESSTDLAVWCCEENILTKNRQTDISLKNNLIAGLKKHALQTAPDYVICAGSSQMMAEIKRLKNQLFGQACILICNLNSPMQCMMGVCGQCLQKVNDHRGYIFTCRQPGQRAEMVDFDNLASRLEQNSVQEKILSMFNSSKLAN